MSDVDEDDSTDDLLSGNLVELSKILNSDSTKLPDVYIINTKYDPQLDENKKFKAPKKG